MTRTLVPFFIIAALVFGAASSAFGLEIEGNFQVGNLGFAPNRASNDASFTGSDYFWGGAFSLRDEISRNMQIEAALTRDLILGNSISALFQFRTDYFRLGLGPYIGLLNTPSTILRSGISTLFGLEVPGVVFLTLRTDSSLGGGTSDYFAQRNEILLGFYAGQSAICTLGLTNEQFGSVTATTVLIDTLTVYSFDVKVFEKNVPYRLDFNAAYQVLQRQYLLSVSHGLDSFIVGTGIDLLFTQQFALTLGFRTSVWTGGTGFLSGLSDFGFSPFLFQGSLGFRVTLVDAVPSSGL